MWVLTIPINFDFLSHRMKHATCNAAAAMNSKQVVAVLHLTLSLSLIYVSAKALEQHISVIIIKSGSSLASSFSPYSINSRPYYWIEGTRTDTDKTVGTWINLTKVSAVLLPFSAEGSYLYWSLIWNWLWGNCKTQRMAQLCSQEAKG